MMALALKNDLVVPHLFFAQNTEYHTVVLPGQIPPRVLVSFLRKNFLHHKNTQGFRGSWLCAGLDLTGGVGPAQDPPPSPPLVTKKVTVSGHKKG